RPAVLTGDGHPGLGTPPVQVTGDGMRYADTRFGLVNSNTSYTYTRDERNAPDSVQGAGERPHQILPKEGLDHQTVAELRGARSVSASSYGNWLFHLPQYDPVNAFDGSPDTAWAEGSAGSPDGQWLRIAFDDSYDMPDSLGLTPLPQDSVRAAATKVRVETERGSETSSLQANGTKQDVKAPAGETRWMKLSIVDSVSGHSGLGGAGFSEIDLPDVRVTRMLRLPTDAEDSTATAQVVSLHRAADPTGLSPTGTENGLHRTFATGTAGTYEVAASAVAVPGEGLDRLLYEVAPEQQARITATADSTARLGAGLSARNLTDGDLTTSWIAGDKPVVHLSWDGKQPVDEIVLAAAGGLSTRPTEVHISSPDGAAIAGVDDNGMVRFPAITTDRLDITITRTAPLTLHNPVVGEDLDLPVGLTEVYVPALDEYRTPQPSADREFTLACGKGPVLSVDGQFHETSVKGTVDDLVERRPVDVTLCQEGREETALELSAGDHRVEAGDEGPLTVTALTLTRGTVPDVSAADRELEVRDWLGDRRELTVGSGAASYLTTYENYNKGWTATLNGEELTPLRLDGWQQGWRIPAGESGTVKLSYGPATTYDAGLIGSGVGIAVLIGLALWRRKAENPDAPQPAPAAPGLWLGAVALTLVGVVIAGWWALLVPALALLAWRRTALLVPVAFAALAGAGIVAAFGAGEPAGAGEGAFGHLAQLLALIGLFAALVSLGGPDSGRTVREDGWGTGRADGTGADEHGTGADGGPGYGTARYDTAAPPPVPPHVPAHSAPPGPEKPTQPLPRVRETGAADGTAGDRPAERGTTG
ncbi:DUF3367 domain-containing protein, partial [Streptomyces hirsutus]|uniref:NADase-type glycan-binding domain-containing protein n=1 Tax=Streptomyces hirsutus TaxID=35620 RepID=UPI00346C1E00